MERSTVCIPSSVLHTRTPAPAHCTCQYCALQQQPAIYILILVPYKYSSSNMGDSYPFNTELIMCCQAAAFHRLSADIKQLFLASFVVHSTGNYIVFSTDWDAQPSRGWKSAEMQLTELPHPHRVENLWFIYGRLYFFCASFGNWIPLVPNANRTNFIFSGIFAAAHFRSSSI